MTTAFNGIAAQPAPAPQKSRMSKARALGLILLAIWIACALGIVYFLISSWNPELVARYGPNYASGLWVTVKLVVISFIAGAILSVPVAMGRKSANSLARGLSYGYVYFFRGTPLLAQTFLIYYGLGSFRPQLDAIGLWWFFRDAWYCAILAFTLNTAAYQAEILRGAIASVPRGQWEAAAALGLSRWITIRKVIAPQAMLVALRPYVNELILLLKGSAIVAIITVFDLMGETRRAYARSFDFQTYIWAALIYLALVELLRIGTEKAEQRLTRHIRRA